MDHSSKPSHEASDACAPLHDLCSQIDALIARLQSCQRELSLHAATEDADLVFVDDFSRYVDDLRQHAEALTLSPFHDLAARYNATLKAAVLILLRIRELHRHANEGRSSSAA